MASNTNRKRTKQHESSLEKAMKRFNDSTDYQKANWYQKWKRDNKLYNNERVYVQYHGVTDTVVPFVFGTVETVTSALNNANLRFDFKSGDPMRQASTAPLNALIDEWWEDDQWDLMFEENEREMIITGMAGNMASWDGVNKRPHVDYGAMCDFIVDPTARNPGDLQKSGYYAGRKYYVRKGELDDYEVVDIDENSSTYGELVKRFKMPKNAGTSVSGTERDDDKTLKEMFSNSTLKTAEDDQDEVIEIWDIDRVVTILNRKDVIEDVENPYKTRHRVMLRRQYEAQKLENAEQRADDEATGLVPFFFFRNYRRSSLFYAKSEIDSIARQAESLNDSRNMQGDAIIKSLARQRELDPMYADWIDLIDEEPETVYPFKPGSLQPIPNQPVDGSSFNYQATTKDEMREAVALDQIMNGQAQQGDQTATEINEVIRQASGRIESKANVLRKDGLYWMSYIIFRMFQLFVEEPLVVEVKGADLEELKTTVTLPNGEERKLPEGAALLDPADYQGDWRPKVTLEVDANSKRAGEQKAAKENWQIIIADPTNNLEEAKKIWYPKMMDLDKDELNRIITQDQMQAQAGMMGGMPMDGSQPVPGAEGAPQAPVAASQAPMPAQPGAEGEIDDQALQQMLTPEELQQLKESMMAAARGGAPAA